MSREVLLLWAGRHRRDDWDRLCRRYAERISRSLSITDIPVRSRGGSGAASRLSLEADALLAAVPETAYLVALDRRGRARSSRDLSRWLGRMREEWPHPIAFVLGSDLGLHESVLKAARERLSLGPLTLPHELARLVLYEQLYRCICIQAGIKYHRDPL